MTVENIASGKKPYRVVQIEGKITWKVEELWDGGEVRQPYGSKHAAINAEEKLARQNGFFDSLELKEVAGEDTMPAGAFDKDERGNWRCLKSCSIDMANKHIAIPPGTVFEKGVPYLGVDVAGWLDKNYSASQRE